MVEFVFGAIGKVFHLLLFLYLLLHLRVEEQALLINHILQYLLRRFEVIPLPVKALLTYRLLLVIMQSIKISMTLFHKNTNVLKQS